jgi:hypothetical protein
LESGGQRNHFVATGLNQVTNNGGVANTPTGMPHEKLIRLLNVLWLLLFFPAVIAVLVGFLSHSPTLGIKTFLLVEFGIAILSPLLTAIMARRNTSARHRQK